MILRSDVYDYTIGKKALWVYGGPGDPTVRRYDKKTFEQRFTLSGHTAPVIKVISDKDTIYSLGGEGDETLRVWDIKTGRLQGVIEDRCGILDVKTDTHFIYTRSRRQKDEANPWSTANTVRVWDKQHFKEAAVFTDPAGIGDVFSDENFIYTKGGYRAPTVTYSGPKNMLIVWDKNEFRQRASLAEPKGVGKVFFDGQYIYIIDGNKADGIRVWRKKTFEECAYLDRHSREIIRLLYDDDHLYSASWDKTLRVWDKHSFEELAVLENLENVYTVRVDGRFIYYASEDNTVEVRDKKNFEKRHTLRGHETRVSAVFLDQNFVYTVGNYPDNSVRVWDKKRFRQQAVFVGPPRMRGVTVDQDCIFYLSPEQALKKWSKLPVPTTVQRIVAYGALTAMVLLTLYGAGFFALF
jgi:WD40 repeat protein